MDNIDKTSLVVRKQTDQEACLFILKNRIKDFRAIENLFVRLGINYDRKKMSKKIGGLQKVIDFVKAIK